MKSTKAKKLLSESLSKESMGEKLDWMGNDYSGPTTDTTIRQMTFHPYIMRHNVSLRKDVTLLLYFQFRVEMVTKAPSLIYTEPKNFLWTGHHVRPDNGIHKVVLKIPFGLLLTKISPPLGRNDVN